MDLRESAIVTDEGVPLLFEKSAAGSCAVTLGDSDVPSIEPAESIPQHLLAGDAPPLPELAELCLVRHFTKLAHRALSITTNFSPLGSCTMRYNPRLDERAAAMPGRPNLHPYPPLDTVRGMAETVSTLREYCHEISGLP